MFKFFMDYICIDVQVKKNIYICEMYEICIPKKVDQNLKMRADDKNSLIE